MEVFHRILSDSNPSQNRSGWDSFNYSSHFLFVLLFLQAFANRSKYIHYNWYHPHPQFKNVLVPWQGQVFSLFSTSLILFWGSVGTAYLQNKKFFFVFSLIKTRSSLLGESRRSACFLKDNFIDYILQDGFYFVHIPFFSMVNFLYFAQFPVDNLSLPVYHIIKGFISVTI